MTSRQLGWLNAGASLSAVLLAILAATPQYGTNSNSATLPETRPPAHATARTTDAREVRDATGTRIELRHFQRIVSASSVADQLLLELTEPERVVAVSQHSKQGPEAFKFSGKPGIRDLVKIERILALSPDLVLVNNVGNVGRVQRLRDAGLAVFDLGQMTGADSLLEDIRLVGRLVGAFERADRLATDFRSRLDRIAAGVPRSERPGGLYLGIHTDKLFGGTKGSNYHDVLEYAGVRDIAAANYSGWPAYEPEAVLRMNPELVVTQAGMTPALCGRPGLSRLRACSAAGRIIELPSALLNDPGLGILRAAELLHDAVYDRR